VSDDVLTQAGTIILYFQHDALSLRTDAELHV
jgi:hypothetical protein